MQLLLTQRNLFRAFVVFSTLPRSSRHLVGISSIAINSRNISTSDYLMPASSSMAASTAKAPTLPNGEAEPPELPKLSPTEFRAYNRMAEMMEYYHNHFRQTWNQLYAATSPSSSSATSTPPLSAPRLITLGLSFISHLTVHHDIEETHIFPILAKRMSSFRPGSAHLLEQHVQIHKGMDALEKYLKECRKGERELRRDEVRGVLDGFGKVLWAHLEEEVKELGAENMRRYWSKEEIAGLPM